MGTTIDNNAFGLGNTVKKKRERRCKREKERDGREIEWAREKEKGTEEGENA